MLAQRPPIQLPRGLYYGWVIVAVMALVGFTQSAGNLSVLGVLLKPMTTEFEWSRSVFTGALTIGTFLGGVLALGVGLVYDRFGPRWTLVVAFAILGGTLVLWAGVTALWQFYLLMILGRVVNVGAVALARSVVISKWFVAKRGRAVALSNLGSQAGNATTPIFVQLLITLASWRIAITTVGLAVLALSLLPIAVFLRRGPEDLGLLPDGRSRRATPKGGISVQNPAEAPALYEEVSLSLQQVVRLPSFYLLVMAFTLASIVVPAMNLHMIPYFTDQGLTPGTAVAATAVYSGSAAFGSLGFGFVAERYKMRMVLTGIFLLASAGIALLLAVDSPATAFLWGFYMGVVQGGMMTLYQVVYADYYGRDSLGAIRGVTGPVEMGARSLGPLAAALAYDARGSYVFVFTLFVALNLVGGFCVFLAQPPGHGRARVPVS